MPEAGGDSGLLQQIYDARDRRPDRDQQPKRVIKEIQALIAGGDGDARKGNSAADSAKITAKYALAGVIITAIVGTLGAAVISNWDKILGHKSPVPVVTPSQTSNGSQSPNLTGAHDITIEYGTSAAKGEFLNVAGKWRT